MCQAVGPARVVLGMQRGGALSLKDLIWAAGGQLDKINATAASPELLK